MTHTLKYGLYGCILALIFGGTGFAMQALSSSEPQTATVIATITEVHEEAPAKTTPEVVEETPLVHYIEIINSCAQDFSGECARAFTEPHASSTVAVELRTGAVLKTAGILYNENTVWHKVVFDEWLRYPERAYDALYIDAQYVRAFTDIGIQELTEPATTTKRIIVDRSEQTLYAYDGDELAFTETISTGIFATPTPRGTFTIFRKTPTRYMQGPLPGVSAKYYDLPGVPWNLYFTHQGAVIHGAYWHKKFGQPWSNGCVNVDPIRAEALYHWADVGTTVIVQD